MKNIKENINIIFEQVLEDVKNGLSIQTSVKKLGISTVMFYMYVTEEQKQKLKYIKTAQSSGNRKNRDIKYCIHDLDYSDYDRFD